MITKLFLSNFRSLASGVDISLDPLTVLVGANGAGKSNVADALQFVGDAFRDGLEHAVASRGGFGPLRRWSRGRPLDVLLALRGQLDEIEWHWALILGADEMAGFRVRLEGASVSLTSEGLRTMLVKGPEASPLGGSVLTGYSYADGAWEVPPGPGLDFVPAPRSLLLPEVAKRDARFQPLVDYLAGLMVYSFSPETMRRPQRPDPTRPMRRDGENWATHLRALDRKTRGRLLVSSLDHLVGDIDGYRVSTVGGLLVPELRYGRDGHRDRWLGAAQESDGTLRVAGILTALLQSPIPSLIGIEQPELGIRPADVPDLLDYLKQVSAHTQVLLTSHSPELLDRVAPESLRFVERRDGYTTVGGLVSEQLDALHAGKFMAGDFLRPAARPGRGEPK